MARTAPETTIRLLLGAAVLGILALSAYSPAVAVGAVSGVVLLTATKRCAGSVGSALTGGALLPIAAVGTVGAVWLVAETALGGVLAALGVLTGMAAVLVGWHTTTAERSMMRTGLASVTVVCGVVTGLLFLRIDVGLVPATFENPTIGWLVATTAVLIAVYSLPPMAYTPISGRSSVTRRRLLLLVLLVGPLVSLWGIVFVATRTPIPGPTTETLAASDLLPAVFVAITVGAVLLTTVGVTGRLAWLAYAEERDLERNPALGVLVGALVGISLLVTWSVFSSPRTDISVLFLATTLLLGGCYLLVSFAPRFEGRSLAVVTGLSLSLVLGGVVVAVDIGDSIGAATGLPGLSAFVAITAGVYVFALGRYGFGLSTDVGETADRHVQLISGSYYGALAVGGLFVSLLSFQLGMRVAPRFSAPAGVAVLAGLVAATVGAFLLLRE